MSKVIEHKSEWKPFSDLRTVQHNISKLGYKKQYIDKYKLEETKIPYCRNICTGVINFFEPLEVKKEDNKIFWRYNESLSHFNIPKTFETQFGIFNNHNHGEFSSWLGKDDYKGLTEEEQEIKSYIGQSDYFIDGNYIDMFDYGEYSYAISNLMHLGLGLFKIVRIDKALNSLILYDSKYDTRLEYAGRFQSKTEYVIIASGHRKIVCKDNEHKFQDIMLIFTIDKNGNCTISNEWNITIPPVNSMAVLNNYLYFGHNKMVSRFNMLSGKIELFTNKTDEEISALTKI